MRKKYSLAISNGCASRQKRFARESISSLSVRPPCGSVSGARMDKRVHCDKAARVASDDTDNNRMKSARFCANMFRPAESKMHRQAHAQCKRGLSQTHGMIPSSECIVILTQTFRSLYNVTIHYSRSRENRYNLTTRTDSIAFYTRFFRISTRVSPEDSSSNVYYLVPPCIISTPRSRALRPSECFSAVVSIL